jgi:acetyl-CoA carboxylase biotin carboxyl carrier protein
MTQQKKDTEGVAQKQAPTDLKHLKNLIDLMVENDLSRLELREGETHILLRRGQPVIPVAGGAVSGSPAPAVPAVSASAAPAEPAADPNEVLIRSPMVGTFYTAPDPESPPFVNIGSNISPDSAVCIVEAMKVFNEIKAEVSGRITRILAKNAEAVEFDQPLFAVAPA